MRKNIIKFGDLSNDALDELLNDVKDEYQKRSASAVHSTLGNNELKKENLKLVQKSVELAAIKRELEDRNFELEATRAELHKQNLQMVRKSVLLSDTIRQLEDSHYELVESKKKLEKSLVERQKAQSQLVYERNLLQTIMDNLPDYVFVKDNQSRFVTTNAAHLQALGASDLKDVIGKTDKSFFPKKLAEDYCAVEGEVIQSKVPIKNLTEKVIQKNGEEKWVLTTKIPIIESDGHVDGLVGISRDITEIKQKEEELRDSEERFKKILNAVQSAIVIVDAETHKIVDLNPEAARMIGAPKDEIIGRICHKFICPNEKGNCPVTDLDKKVEQAKRVMLTLQGKEIPILKTVSLLKIKGKTHVVDNFIDITDLTNAENLVKESLEEKETLLKEIHHRVKNNLQIISSLLYLQSRKSKQQEATDLLLECRSRVQSMSLIHEKLYKTENFANIHFEDYIYSFTHQLFDTYLPSGSSVSLNVDAANIVLPVEQAVPVALIINELVTNALKYAFPKKRNGRIDVKLLESNGGGNTSCQLVVMDDGVGFPKDIDYKQTSSLGMQLVNSLSAQLGGNVELSNGNGTCFKITFISN